MKKILFPILTSAALVPTIAATSCGIYWVENITIFETDHMIGDDTYSCSNGAGYEWIVHFDCWEDENNPPQGIFKLTDADQNAILSEYYHFGSKGQTTVYVDETPVSWDYGTTNSEIKITQSGVDLLNTIVKIKTSIIVVASETETYFSFEAW